MTPPTICVTGASGKIGKGALNTLLKILNYPATSIIVSTSNPLKLSSLTSDGIQIRHGDLADPESLRSAYAGAEKLLLVSYPTMEHTSRFNFHKAGIDAAIDAGVKHIYYTSLAYNGEPSVCPIMWAHADTEKYLKERGETAGIKYTLIREGLYNEAFPHNCGLLDIQKVLADPEQDREIIIHRSGDALVSYASIADLAEATGRIIAHEGPDYNNRLVLLSGPKGYSIKDVARIISSTLSLDPPLRIKSVTREEYVNHHLVNSQPSLAWMIYPPGSDQKIFLENLAGAAKAEENGEAAATGELLGKVLGRKPTNMEETVPTILSMLKGKL